LNDKTISYLKSAYRAYYYRAGDSIGFPDQIKSREFGYIPFGGGMVRHLSFKSSGDATVEILRQSPSSVYCSNATYESPTLPMESKGWKGAELIFDVDATDIPTSCKKGHDFWYCEKCHSSGKLPRPHVCPRCKGPTADFHGTCRFCLDAAREHTLRVIDFLAEDFGVKAKDIVGFFSGNRGYHLQVYDSRFHPLDQKARAEICDYMLGSSLPPSQTVAATLRRRPSGSQAAAFGWMRRIATYAQSKSDSSRTVQKLVSEAVVSQRAMIDASVTTDIHRVFRLAGTLHGNTGMAKTKVDSFESFDPERDPVVLGEEETRISVSFYPKFSMKGQTFGPFSFQTVSLPSYAAVPILTRGFGEVA